MMDWICLLVVRFENHICIHCEEVDSSVMGMTLQGLNSLIRTFISLMKKHMKWTPFGFQQRVLFISYWVEYVCSINWWKFSGIWIILSLCIYWSFIRLSTKKFTDHTRSLVHIHKCNNVTPNYLLMDLVLRNKLGVAYAQDLVIHVIVYGISGYHNNVLLCVCVCGMKIMK